MNESGANENKNLPNGTTPLGNEWIAIQQKTFTNWINEHLSVSGKSIQNIETDFSDGVNLVALVECLQLKKIGKITEKPTKKIQKIQNVSIACKAITEDNVKLVNIGNEDIVNGNIKLILGLIWHLIMRYQISSRKTKAPPKKLMIEWFRTALPELEINNFTGDWNDGILLHALIDYLRPGTSPNWRELHSKNRVENCRTAMVLAKEHLNIPRVISPEDFASDALDELSAMTYLSYFVKSESPGYYATLNWICKQLRTTTITNLTTDWNDGYNLCAVVDSLGANVPGFPNLDRSQHEENCQKAIDGGISLGIEPVLTAKELSDPNVDHLGVMTYLSRFQNIKPKKADNEKLKIKAHFDNLLTGIQTAFQLHIEEKDVERSKTKIDIQGPHSKVDCEVTWKDKTIDCRFIPNDSGNYVLNVYYADSVINGCPIKFYVKADLSTIKILTQSGTCRVGSQNKIEVDASKLSEGSVTMEAKSPTGDIKQLECERDENICICMFQPKVIGIWQVHINVDGEEIANSPISFDVFDPQKVWLSCPERGIAGEVIVYTGTFKSVEVVDPGQILVTGEGIAKVKGCAVATDWKEITTSCYEFFYTPLQTGVYKIKVMWDDREVTGSPFQAKIIDRSRDHYIHLYWSDVPLDFSPVLGYCQGPELPIDHTKVVVSGKGLQQARATVPAEIKVDGKKAGPGIPKVLLKGVKCNPEVDVKPMKYDRYKCTYNAPFPGGYLLYVYWSDNLVPGSPYKLTVTTRGASNKVKVSGAGLKGGFVGQELRVVVDISEAGNGEISANCKGHLHGTRCDVIQQNDGLFTLRVFPTEASHHTLDILYDGEHVPGSPFNIPVGEPPDPRKVKVYGPGIEDGLLQTYESKFIVETYGAGAGQLAIHAFKVEMEREAKNDRTILCHYDPTEPGEYVINVKWSGYHVRGSPFRIKILESYEELEKITKKRNSVNIDRNSSESYSWREEI
ncbi:hypothetical protein KUTeg_012153 [Tegillarca granosa]|uniref:Calponin-homology (CH) domain-containing protein n=1 Tax=Tegillarca granosa TaxID=220873 RepID=A0ABQ9F3X5_TEGGR|nr:hypothetical protein KUTeg_012153 [Tegillarca granosa]